MCWLSWLVERFWLTFPGLFEPVQNFFNADFFSVVAKQFVTYPHKKILDLGCGVGTLLTAFHPQQYVGIDINLALIRLAQDRYAHREGINFICGDALKYTSKKRFDLITLISLAHHLPDQQLEILLNQLSKKITFSYLLLIDCQPSPTIWKPFLQLLDIGANFREHNDLRRFFKKDYMVIKSGNLTASKSWYYYPFILAKNKKTA